MPNWCKNFLHVSGPQRTLARFQTQATPAKTGVALPATQAPEVFSFHRLVPAPSAPLQPITKAADLNTPRKRRWGCRSEAWNSTCEPTPDGGLLYLFVTARTPPLAFLREVSRRWPALVFTLDYDEPMLAITGHARAVNGRLQSFTKCPIEP